MVEIVVVKDPGTMHREDLLIHLGSVGVAELKIQLYRIYSAAPEIGLLKFRIICEGNLANQGSLIRAAASRSPVLVLCEPPVIPVIALDGSVLARVEILNETLCIKMAEEATLQTLKLKIMDLRGIIPNWYRFQWGESVLDENENEVQLRNFLPQTNNEFDLKAVFRAPRNSAMARVRDRRPRVIAI